MRGVLDAALAVKLATLQQQARAGPLYHIIDRGLGSLNGKIRWSQTFRALPPLRGPCGATLGAGLKAGWRCQERVRGSTICEVLPCLHHREIAWFWKDSLNFASVIWRSRLQPRFDRTVSTRPFVLQYLI